jgi:ElaB/YqjD/DUF883 family membrane-anchored ribosome-binding protein
MATTLHAEDTGNIDTLKAELTAVIEMADLRWQKYGKQMDKALHPLFEMAYMRLYAAQADLDTASRSVRANNTKNRVSIAEDIIRAEALISAACVAHQRNTEAA